MRYDDTSGSFNSASTGAPDARDDTDNLAAGSRGPATGNAISGEGTVTGAAGADIIGNAPGQIVALQGANGSDTADSGGSLTAAGRHGTLTMNQDGGYSYRPNGAAPENARDVFSYTLADQAGGRDTALLAIDIGHTPSVAANAQQIVPGPDGVVTLPPGVELSDVHVVGRNLVIDMPDGSQMVIIDGAVFVPQLVLNGVEVPSSNLAALLIDSEPKPAAGTPQSGGGNFAVDVGPLDPGVPLGDLIPPTNLIFTPPTFEEVNQIPDDEPEIIIIPDGQPGAVNAVDSVDESGLPERVGEPEGTLEPQDIETTTGVISISGDDGIDSVTINGVEIDSIGDTVETARGILTIISIDLDSGQIGYSYTATDNTTDGVDDFDDFTVVVTDNDGDTATGTLHIDILDDEPIARNDTDSVTAENPTAVGNVMTAVGTTNSPAGVDTVGADDATLTAVQGVGPVDTTFDINGNLVVQGEYGTLTIDAEGNYTYELTSDLPEAADTDVFTYTLTDGDGDTATATLTITIPGDPNDIPEILRADDSLVDEDGLDGANVDAGRPGEVDSTEDNTDTGQILVDFKGDVPANLLGAIAFINPSALNGQLTTPAGVPITFTVNGSGQLVGSDGTNDVIIIEFTAAAPQGDGQVLYTYTVELLGPVEHPVEGVEDTIELEGITVQVTDSNGDTDSATFDAAIVDDLPIAVEPPENPQDPEGPPIAIIRGAVDEDDLDTGNNDVAPGDDLAINSSTTVNGAAGSLAGLFNAGADQPLTFALNSDTSGLPALFSNGVQVDYVVDGDTLTATAGGNPVFTLTVNPDGSWSFELEGQLDHPDTTTEDNIDIDFSSIISAEDADGDPVTAADGAFVINVDDDSPTAIIPPIDPENPNDPPAPLVSGAVDEDDLDTGNNDVAPGDDLAINSSTTVNGAAGSLAGLFNAGADQPLTFALNSDTSGLPALFSNGVQVDYVVDGDTLTATAGGNPVFTLTVNPDGSWSFELEGQLDHPDTTTEDNIDIDFSSIISAEDADGDPVTAADGAFVINVDDDSPTAIIPPIDPENPNDPPAPLVSGAVDEDDLDTGNNDVAPGDDLAINSSTTVNGAAGSLAGLFNAGADQPLTFALNSDTSGLPALFSNGVQVDYVVDGDTLTATAGGNPVFTLTVNPDGSWSFELEGQLDHPDTTTEDNIDIDFSSIISAEDADGDPVTAADGAFVINVDDDSPVANDDTDELIGNEMTTDGNVITGTGTTSGAAGVDAPGADLVSTITAISGADGTDTTFESGVLEIHGEFGTLTIDADGNYTYERDADAVQAGTDTFTYTLTDSDGDSSEATLTITLPNINTVPTPFSGDPFGVDEDGLPNANSDEGQVDPDEVNNGGNASRTGFVTVDYGNDRPGDTEAEWLDALAFTSVGDLNGQLTQNDAPISFAVVGGVLVGYTGSDETDTSSYVMTIEFTGAVAGSGGNVTYEYEVTLLGPVDHTEGDQTEGLVQLVGIEVTATDSNGDQESGTFTGTIYDDVPTASAAEDPQLPTLVVDESPVGEDEGGDNDPAGVRTATADFSGAFGAFEYGADGAGSVTYGLSLNGSDLGSGLYALGVGGAQGDEIMLVDNGDGTISGMVGTDVYFTISADAAGNVTFEQFINVWHSDTASDDDSSFLSAAAGTILLEQTVTDADGDFDTASVDLSDDVFAIEDDGPTANDPEAPQLPTLVVDESPVGEDEGGDSDPAGVRTATADFSGAFGAVAYGTDGAGTVTYGLSLNGSDLGSGLYALGVGGAQGDEIMLVDNGDGTISGMVGTDVYFTISADAAGNVTFEQFINVWHSDTASDDDTSFLSAATGTILLEQTITDSDGDTDTASVDLSDDVFAIEDDGPTANDPEAPQLPTLVVDESPIDEDEGGDNDPAGVRTATADFSGAFGAVEYGTDGAGTVTYGLSLNGSDLGSGLYALDNTDTETSVDGYGQGDEIMLVDNGDGTISGMVGTDVYFTISADASGNVTFEQFINVWHSDDSDHDDTSTLDAAAGTITLVQTVTDADGDTDTASVDLSSGVFNIEDDGPTTFVPDSVNVEQGGSASASLDIDDGDVTNNYGTDGPGTVRFPASIEGTDSGLTSNTATIFYHIVDDTHLQGVLADDTVIFTITLNDTDVADPNDVVGSSYTIDLVGQIDSLTQIDFDAGSYAHTGGNDPWFGFFIAGNNDSQDLLITPVENGNRSGTINLNANLFGVSQQNSVGTGEAVRVDFVTDLTGNAAGSGGYETAGNRDHAFEGHYDTNGATASFGSTPGATVRISAYDDPDGNSVVGDGVLDNVTGIAISYGGEQSDLITTNGTYNVGGHDFTVTFDVVAGTVDVAGVTGNSNGTVTTDIAVFTDDGYNALQFNYVSGTPFLIGNFGAAIQSTDPVPFSVPVEIVDADGDVVGGTDLDITVYAVGDLPAADAFASLSIAKTSAIESQSLLSEDSGKHHRGFDAANNNSVLLGAIAAAGLASAPAAAKDSGPGEESDGSQLASLTVEAGSNDGSDAESQASHALTGEIQEAVDGGADGGDGHKGHSNDNKGDHSLTDGNAHETQAPSELLAGTDTPQPDAPAQSSFTSPGVAMPSAEMLAAAKAEGGSEGEAKSNAVVEQVLADALAGGGDGTDIDAVIEAVANQHGGPKGSADGLASDANAAVSHWDTAGLAGFPGGHTPFTMEAIQLHHDAVQPAA